MTLRTHYQARCPFCGSRDFEEESEHDGDDLLETCTCNDCQHVWTNVYQFVEWDQV